MLIMGYLGAVVGAGFASGQEIIQFFVRYHGKGINGAILSIVLFAICGGLLLFQAHQQKSAHYQDILKYLLGEKLSRVVDVLLAIFLFLGISTMLSASGAVFYEHLYLPGKLGIFLAYFVVILLLISGRKGLFISYNMLVPVKVLLIICVAGYALFKANTIGNTSYLAYLPEPGPLGWGIAGVLYVAYNFSLAMVVLTEYQSIGSKKDGIIGAVLGGAVLGLIVTLNYCALNRFVPMVMHYEVPMLYVAGQISMAAKHTYSIVLWIGIITTAMANAYGFTQRFSSYTRLDFKICLILSMTLALPLSMQSFSTLVAYVYPISGILGLIIVGALIFRSGQDIIMKRKK